MTNGEERKKGATKETSREVFSELFKVEEKGNTISQPVEDSEGSEMADDQEMRGGGRVGKD